MKIRVMPNQSFIEFMKILNANATPISAPELPAALTTGVIDGQENPVSVIVEKKLYELQDHITLDGHVYSADFLVINDDLFQGLSDSVTKPSSLEHLKLQGPWAAPFNRLTLHRV